jgi:hypothetical protein
VKKFCSSIKLKQKNLLRQKATNFKIIHFSLFFGDIKKSKNFDYFKKLKTSFKMKLKFFQRGIFAFLL